MFSRIGKGAGILVLAVMYFSDVLAVGNTDLGNGVVSVTQPPYNAPTIASNVACNSSTPTSQDATTAIQAALNDVGAAPGGIVFLPTGIYCIKSHISIPTHTALKGIYVAPPTRKVGPSGGVFPVNQGTVLLAVENAGNPSGTPFITLAGSSSVVDGLTIYYPNQLLPASNATGYSPVAYPYAIRGNEDAVIQNIFMVNPYYGIDLYTNPCSRHIVRGIYGTPLANGIQINNCLDVGRISNIHFWPFWAYNDAVWEWTRQNGRALIVGRTDGQIIEDVFVFNYFTGFLFYDFGQGPPGVQMSNINLDAVSVGFDIYAASPGAGIKANNLNIAILVDEPTLPNIAIWRHQSASSANLTVINGAFNGNYKQAVRWDGDGLFSMTNGKMIRFTAGYPVISVIDGSAMIQNSAFTGGAAGNIAIDVAPTAGKTLITGNLLYGMSLQINNGALTMQANNMP